jgi:type III secretory pathway component EscR
MLKQERITDLILDKLNFENSLKQNTLYTDIEVLKSNLNKNIYIRYKKLDMVNNEADIETKMIEISEKGKINYDVFLKKFENAEQRNLFFNSLYKR